MIVDISPWLVNKIKQSRTIKAIKGRLTKLNGLRIKLPYLGKNRISREGSFYMPRLARKKSNESIYHVMCRSISEINLLNDDEDKLKYISLIKKYKKLYKFNIYSYCFMKNHLHLILDSNGADISRIMHGINFSYARYFNKKYKRHGHLFQDRFKSKIIDTDRYLITASAYIHNNPTDIEGFASNPEKYKFSSLAVYLGIINDPFGLVDSSFVLSLFGKNLKQVREQYYKFVFKCNNNIKEDIEFENEGTLYASQRIILERNLEAEQLIEYVAQYANVSKATIFAKYGRKGTGTRALLVVLLKSLCNFNSRKICEVLGNITQANVSRLAGIGLGLMETDEKFRILFEEGVKNQFAI
jgi:putative transposase